MKTRIFSVDGAEVTSEAKLITDGGLYVFAISGTADFGGGTVELELYDNDSGEKLATSAEKYQFTEAFEPFEIRLAPGIKIEFTITGAAAPDIEGIYMFSPEW